MTLRTLRKSLEGLGYKVQLRINPYSCSGVRYATYVHTDSGERLTFTAASPDVWDKWQPLFGWIRAHSADVYELGEREGVRGLLTGC